MPECRHCYSDDISKYCLDKSDYICKKCQKEASRKRYIENRDKYLERSKANYKSEDHPHGSEKWAKRYLAQQRYRDRKNCRNSVCDLTVEQLQIIILEPCNYCGDSEDKMTVDRLNNDYGHTYDNVVACCHTCNSTRLANFSPEEMKIIGEAIKKVKENRRL